MSADDGSRADALAQTRITRLFRWHAWAYGVLMGGLAAVNIYVGGGWWSF